MEEVSMARYSASAPLPLKCFEISTDPKTSVPIGKLLLPSPEAVGTLRPTATMVPEKSVSAMIGGLRKIIGIMHIRMMVPGCRATCDTLTVQMCLLVIWELVYRWKAPDNLVGGRIVCESKRALSLVDLLKLIGVVFLL